MDFKDLEILRNGNNNLRQQNENLKKQLEKTCKQYLDLYNKIEKTKELVKDLIKKEQHKIETNDYIIMYLEEFGDLKQILNSLER